MLDNALYTYFISKSEHKDFSQHTPFGEYVVSHTKKTDICTAENDTKKVMIIGFCVDAHAEIERENISFLQMPITRKICINSATDFRANTSFLHR